MERIRWSVPNQQIGTLLLLLVLLVLNCYRAATQSITIDEAYAYERFVSQPILTSITTYEAAHHILHTFGCVAFVRMFGAGVVPLRLTSLIFGFVYLWAVWRLSVGLFPSSSLSLLATAFLGMNPYVLDFMSAARGYGMALALFAWAVIAAFQLCEEVCLGGRCDPRVIRRISILATLAVGANLSFAFPVVPLLVAIAIIAYRRAGSTSVRTILLNIAVPAAAIFCLFAAPLAAATRNHFYFGVSTLRDTMLSLYSVSFDQDWPMIGVLPGARAALNSFLVYLLFLLGGVVILVTARLLNRSALKRDPASPQHLQLGLAAGVLAGSLLMIADGHRFAGILYPYARTCIYVIFLCSLIVLLATSELTRSGHAWRAFGFAAIGVMMLIAGLYVVELRWQWYGDWKFDAGTGSLMRSLSAERHSSPPPVRLGVSWVLQSSAEFYREIYHMDWLQPVTRDLPSCEDDYILLTSLDRGMVDTLGLEVLRQDQVSGTTLAKRTTKSCATK